MNETLYRILLALLMAGITFFLRAVPFLFFGHSKSTPKVITWIGTVLPYAIMSMLVIFCLKDQIPTLSTLGDFSYPYMLPEMIASLVVIGLHIWKKNTLLSVGVGVVLYMVLVQVVFV